MLSLITFNRWWSTGKVDSIYLKPFKRNLFLLLKKFLDTRQILLIYGLRRVGKTTILYQLIDYLLERGIDKKEIFYFSFDEKITSLESLFRNYIEIVLGEDILKRKKIYVFLDEIQKLENWTDQLKIFYDLYPNVKFIVSGSASLVISQGAKESLAGRIYEFVLHPLNFSEYLEFLGEKTKTIKIFDLGALKNTYLKKENLLPLLFSYIKSGGFIEIAREKDELKLKEYSKSILEKVILGDIVFSFGIKYPQVLYAILELTASNPGFLLDYSNLAKIIDKDPRMIADYLFYLKYALITKVLYNFSGSRFASERKLKKCYFTSTNFIYHFAPEKFNDPEFFGKIIENLIVAFEESSFFWRRRQNEVDLILEKEFPLEVKWKKKILKRDLRGILNFTKRFKPKKAIVLTQDELSTKKIEGTEFYFIPVWIYLLKTTPNSLDGKF